MKQQNKKSGFTLVELAIVLVIIGLIVGGVLAGQDLIKAAEQRAAVGQFEKLDTVVNAFRGKYNGLPGDIASPGNFGMIAPSVTTTQGNGVLDPQATAGAGNTLITQEVAAFFGHLASASLINESIAPTAPELVAAAVNTNPGHYVPLSKLGKGIFLFAGSVGGTNYYMLDNATLAATGVLTNVRSALSPLVAYNLDTKLDDGNPTTGKVSAVDGIADAASTSANGGALSGKCVDTTGNDSYQTSTAAIGDFGACAIRVKASF